MSPRERKCRREPLSPALADPGRLELTVQVAEIDIPRIEIGRPVDVVIDAFPDETYAGVISRVEPFKETQSGVISYPVTIRLLDERFGLRIARHDSCSDVAK